MSYINAIIRNLSLNEGNIEAVCFGVKLNSICPDLKMFCHFYFVSSIYTDAFGHKVLFSTSLVALVNPPSLGSLTAHPLANLSSDKH